MSSQQQAHPAVDRRGPTTAESNPTDQPPATPATGGQQPAPLPPDATVLATPRGGRFHQPLGSSHVPKCGARSGNGEVDRMTRYRAMNEEDLDACGACFSAE